MVIIAHMEKVLEVEEMEIRKLFEDFRQSMKMNYYPPCPQPDKVIGLTPHSDGVGLTILLQVNEVEGLQVKKDGMWVPIKPLPNAFIINIGEILEAMEEIKYVSGTSLLVPSVQELAKDKFSVPQRYIQPQHEDMVISEQVNGTLEIPVIDMHNLLSQESGTSEMDKLHLACKEWGFFQLINHDVDSSLVEKVKLELQDFFNLPMSEKKKFWQTPQHMEGFGQAFVVSEDQKLDWSDLFYMITLPKHSRMPHLFPQLPLPFRDTLELYSHKMKNLAMAIIGQMGKVLKIEETELRELFEDGLQMMRMNYYPPCTQPEKVIGLTNHSDAAVLTILLQVNEVEGLQIRKDGIWVPVKPLPNAFVVNVGDILEIITNGLYRSIEHRATVNSEKERLSFATFYSPRQDGVIGPWPNLITEQNPAQFKRIGVEDYFKSFFARKLEGKSHRDAFRIEHHNSSTPPRPAG